MPFMPRDLKHLSWSANQVQVHSQQPFKTTGRSRSPRVDTCVPWLFARIYGRFHWCRVQSVYERRANGILTGCPRVCAASGPANRAWKCPKRREAVFLFAAKDNRSCEFRRDKSEPRNSKKDILAAAGKAFVFFWCTAWLSFEFERNMWSLLATIARRLSTDILLTFLMEARGVGWLVWIRCCQIGYILCCYRTRNTAFSKGRVCCMFAIVLSCVFFKPADWSGYGQCTAHWNCTTTILCLLASKLDASGYN